MFKLTRPCSTCPFRIGQSFFLGKARLREIFAAPAFQCHKTVDYENFEDARLRQGNKPQQCAGLMSLLARADRPNQIMQVGERLGHFDPRWLDHSGVYGSIRDCIAAHEETP